MSENRYPGDMPQLREINGRKALYVHGRPFIILGLQMDCEDCFSAEYMDFLISAAARIQCNSVSLLLYWKEIEPVEGVYDFAMLDHRIEQARKNGLKIVLVWFGSYKNGSLFYAPDYIKNDNARFRKVIAADGSVLNNFSCPTSENTHERDRLALAEVFKHLREVDGEENTVVLFQMENETGIFGSDRCYCDTCTKEFTEGGWVEKYGGKASDSYSAFSIARYCDTLAGSVKQIYPLPIYMNCWLLYEGRVELPGKDYPSGGPVADVLDIYRDTVKNIDFISPDIYQHSYREFHSIARKYSWEGNPFYVAEHSSGKGGRAEKNVFYAVGEYSGIGFDPWALDATWPDIFSEPLVNAIDGRLSEEAYELRDSYYLINNAMHPIAMAQNTQNLGCFVQEEAEEWTKLDFGDVLVEIEYKSKNTRSRGMVVRLGEKEFLILAKAVSVRFCNNDGTPLSMHPEKGRYEGEAWKPRFLVKREYEDYSVPLWITGCDLVKVRLF